MRSLSLSLALLLGGWLLVGPAAAQDAFEQINRARRAFEEQRHQEVLRLLEPMVAVPNPTVSGLAAREAHKYLGASYVMLNRRTAAQAQFTQLLDAYPQHTLDPNAFPPGVITLFGEVKSRIAQQGTQEQHEAELAQLRDELSRQRAERERLQLRVDQLEPLATTIEVEQHNSRWLALLPFGVGQFRNGRRGLGIFFAAAESFFVVTSVATFIWHSFVVSEGDNIDPNSPDPEAENSFTTQEQISRVLNVVSVASLGGLALVGMIEAQIRFVPVIRTTRQRELPPVSGGLLQLGLRF